MRNVSVSKRCYDFRPFRPGLDRPDSGATASHALLKPRTERRPENRPIASTLNEPLDRFISVSCAKAESSQSLHSCSPFAVDRVATSVAASACLVALKVTKSTLLTSMLYAQGADEMFSLLTRHAVPCEKMIAPPRQMTGSSSSGLASGFEQPLDFMMPVSIACMRLSSTCWGKVQKFFARSACPAS